MRRWIAAAAVAGMAAALVRTAPPEYRAPRERAIERGLRFLYERIALDPRAFEEWGHDLLAAFYNIAETSADPELRRDAWRMGHERAQAWRKLHAKPAPDAGANEIANLVFGHDAATRLGVPDARMDAALRAAAARYSPEDFLWFDPIREGPPADIPEMCECGRQNERGATRCTRCGAALTMQSRYDLFQDALIVSYSGDRAGITLGRHYRDVLRRLPSLRPYPARGGPPHEYYAGVYTITHVIYTYNDYSQYRVAPGCFPEEFADLKAHARVAEEDHDPETMGEFLDTLRAFGMTSRDAAIREGIDYLLKSQNPDGSWGDATEQDIYGRYHPTWTAIDGLREYRWTRILPCPGF